MAEELVVMSAREIDRLGVIQQVLARRVSRVKAGELLGLSAKQVARLCAAYERQGAAGLVSRRRGRPSNTDDATSRLMELLFAPTESAFSYFQATASYLGKHGKPVAFYSDRHSVFRAVRERASGTRGITQFARALGELNKRLAGCRRKVEVHRWSDGRVAIVYEGASLPFRVAENYPFIHPGDVVERKRIRPRGRRQWLARGDASLPPPLRGAKVPALASRRVHKPTPRVSRRLRRCPHRCPKTGGRP